MRRKVQSCQDEVNAIGIIAVVLIAVFVAFSKSLELGF